MIAVRSGRFATWCLVVLAGASAAAAPPVPGKRGALHQPEHAVSRDNARQIQSLLQQGDASRGFKLGGDPRALAASDSLRFVALRIEFPDLAFGASPPADEVHDRFYYQNHFRNVSQYFDTASAGRMSLQVEVADLVAVAAFPAATYGDVAAYDSLIVELTAEAVRATDALVDFAAYDGVLLIHAGPGQESDIAGDSPTQLWSGYLDAITFREQLSTPDSTVLGIPTGDATLVTNVVLLPEWQVQDLQATGGTRFGSLGVYAHEIGQRLGMIPLFDSTPAPFPDSQGLGNFDLMAYGLWVANGFIPSLPSTFNRMLMGWIDPIDASTGGDFVLRDAERGAPDSVVVRVPISAREYFLVSYVLEDPDGPRADRPCAAGTCFDTLVTRRFFDFDNQDANCCFGYEDVDGNGQLSAADRIDSYAGAEWDFFLTDLGSSGSAGNGAGLLVLHVDEQALLDVLGAGSTNVNGDPRRKAVDVEEADGIEDLDRFPDNPRAFGSAADYFVHGRSFGTTSVPDSRSADGAPTGISIALVAFPDSSARSPGPRTRVRITFDALAASDAAPSRIARRTLPGEHGADLVALPLAGGRAGLLVPGSDGRLFLADAALDEAPVADADPATLAPWVTVPATLRGDWIGAPAVGDVDGDGAPDVVACAQVDSLGNAIVRVFGWSRDGRELRDGDANPLTNTGFLRSLIGRGTAPLLADLDGDAAHEIAIASTTANSVGVTIVDLSSAPPANPACRWGSGTFVAGGPARVVRGLTPPSPGSDLVWVVSDSTGEVAALQFARTGCRTLAPLQPPVRIATGDLDLDGSDDIVLVDGRGEVRVIAVEEATPRATARVEARWISPLALADLDDDGTLEILFATESALHALSFTAAELRGWPFAFARIPALERESDPGRGSAAPLVADLDGDGALDVLLHLPGGALVVCDARGGRRPELEAAVPARAAGTPLLADLDASPGLEFATVGRFTNLTQFDAPTESLTTVARTEIATWRFGRGGRVAWSQFGGDSGHGFRDVTDRTLRTQPNDATLADFVVGPNPATGEVRARVQLTAASTVHCALYTLEGERVRSASQSATAGALVEFKFDCTGLAAGVYFAQMRLSTGGVRTRPVAIRR